MTSRTRTSTRGRTLLALALLGATAPLSVAVAQGGSLAVRVENALSIARPDETISLPWARLQSALPAIEKGRVRVVEPVSGREVVSQVVDANGDGQPEELIFQADFRPGETRAFSVEAAASTLTPKSRVYAYHMEERDDIAWESDRIAFRMYGQGLKKTKSAMSSSGVDIWVKKVRDPIIDKWYSKGHDSYHIDSGEGADFYDVGETLGAGGTAVWRDGRMYRADNFTSYKILANGPIRVMFELHYPAWDANGLKVSEVKRITLDAGQNLFKQEVIYTAPGATSVPYVIGEVKRPGMVGTESITQPWAWITGWGPVALKNGGHGELGTAILIPRDRLVDWKEIKDHYLAISNATPGQPAVHWVGGGWTDSGDFRDVRDWWRYLDQFALRLATPLKVTTGSGASSATGR